MSLNYDKLKSKPHGSGDFWTSYADLATVLTTIFLAMYAVATLRSTTMGVAEQVSRKANQREVEELRKQVQAFEVLKDGYMAKSASDAEKQAYNDLIGQMRLLESEAAQEKETLQKQMQDADRKAKGLNQYQAMIKNIITANMLAQEKLKKRDKVIALGAKRVKELKESIAAKEQAIQRNNIEVERIQRQLESSIARIKQEQRSKTQSKKLMEERIAKLREESAAQVRILESQNKNVSRQLSGVRDQLGEKAKEVAAKEQELAGVIQAKTEKEREYETKIAGVIQAKTEKEREYEQKMAGVIQASTEKEREYQNKMAGVIKESTEKEREYQTKMAGVIEASTAKEREYEGKMARIEDEKNRAIERLSAQEAGFEEQIAKSEREYRAKMESDRAQFQAALAKEKLSAEERLTREAEYRGQAEKEKQNYVAGMKSLSDQLENTRKAIGDREAKYQSEVGRLESTNRGLAKELAAAKAREAQTKRIAGRIQDAFRRAGVDATIDPKTGEVTLNFANEYFEYGSSNLTKGMSQILKNAIPAYAKSLFEDPELAKKIGSVEIVGFSSPTYKGKYINPRDLSPEARRAVNYNLDLSYQRAKAIFEHVFDTSRMQYSHQKELLSHAKVSGRGYLRSTASEEDNAKNVSDAEYCLKVDCTKSQRVVIKFNFVDKD